MNGHFHMFTAHPDPCLHCTQPCNILCRYRRAGVTGRPSYGWVFLTYLCSVEPALSALACSEHLNPQPLAAHMAKRGCCACRNTYTALNALAGHFNSFGTTAPLPKKRLERINKELDDATKMLGRGR